MSQHGTVSSDEQGEMEQTEEMVNLHQGVSSESPGLTGETQMSLIAEDSAGAAEADLEDVDGFDPTMALNEGQVAEEVKLTSAMKDLVAAASEEFLEPESVCGSDNRFRISPASSFPWRLNCQLIITRADGRQTRCTGWFSGPRTVMTAGHCLYSHAAGGWARQIEVIPGMDSSSRPYGSQISTSFRSVRGWVNSRNAEYDYGAIILPNNTLGNRVGWFGFAVLSTGELQNLLVNNSGYPADKPFGTQWYNAGRITRVTDRQLFYMIDTFGGQSGSVVYRYRNGARHAVGIHGYGGCPNRAARITGPVFDNMLAWRNLGF
ncbi:MAG: serine protease [Chloroflexota bacterium]